MLSILKNANQKDIETINEFFERQENQTKSGVEREMEKLQREIDSLEEVTSSHQGFKFYRTLMSKDTFEDALVELREKEFDKKFRDEKEKMIGSKYKTV